MPQPIWAEVDASPLPHFGLAELNLGERVSSKGRRVLFGVTGDRFAEEVMQNIYVYLEKGVKSKYLRLIVLLMMDVGKFDLGVVSSSNINADIHQGKF